ncbi:MAG: diacylglycerol kinase family lipid kinase [Actinobacteria bacterium]|nr:diacylglycerol kinase family lipid kinase [Actinomycetota bacterium]
MGTELQNGENAAESWKFMVIVNPEAGDGVPVKIWDELQRQLEKNGVAYDYAFTEAPGHAVKLAEKASFEGYRTVVAVGGDGTVYEVVNGLMAVSAEKRPAMGVIPCGKGGDFCRTVQIPSDVEGSVSLLLSGERRTIDVGKMTYRSDHEDQAGYFINITGLGFDAEVTDFANNVPEWIARTIGGTPVYLISLLITYITYKERDIKLRIDNKPLRVVATSVIFANCQYFGGKMWIAPNAKPDDGLFDIVVLGAGYGNPVIELPPGETVPARSLGQRFAAKMRMLKNIPRVFKGKHIDDPSVMVLKGKSVTVLSKDRLLVQSDGEVIGEAPFTAEIVPGALRLIVPSSCPFGR